MLNTDIIEYYRATIDSDSHLKRSVSFLNTFLVPANTAAYPSHRFLIETMQTTARSFGIQLLPLELQLDDFRDAFIAIDKHGADAFVVNADPGLT